MPIPNPYNVKPIWPPTYKPKEEAKEAELGDQWDAVYDIMHSKKIKNISHPKQYLDGVSKLQKEMVRISKKYKTFYKGFQPMLQSHVFTFDSEEQLDSFFGDVGGGPHPWKPLSAIVNASEQKIIWR